VLVVSMPSARRPAKRSLRKEACEFVTRILGFTLRLPWQIKLMFDPHVQKHMVYKLAQATCNTSYSVPMGLLERSVSDSDFALYMRSYQEAMHTANWVMSFQAIENIHAKMLAFKTTDGGILSPSVLRFITCMLIKDVLKPDSIEQDMLPLLADPAKWREESVNLWQSACRENTKIMLRYWCNLVYYLRQTDQAAAVEYCKMVILQDFASDEVLDRLFTEIWPGSSYLS